MQSGVVWEAICDSCGRLASIDCRWQEDEPGGSRPHAHSCCDDLTADAHWERTVVQALGYMRMSGFSTSESDFVPHWNRAFGKPVHSLAEMKALQAKHGVSDAVVKGDGLERLAPRDILTRVKKHNEVREVFAHGGEVEVAKGVRARISTQTEAD